VDAGNLAMIYAPWNDSFIAELKAFPDSAKDDQVDALSRAVNTLATTNRHATRRVTVSLLGR
jgi:predicted phage terminase large subunit-like protein